MSRKMKLVLRNVSYPKTPFVIVKTVNTLSHGVPGNKLSRLVVDQILTSKDVAHGTLTVEFLDK